MGRFAGYGFLSGVVWTFMAACSQPDSIPATHASQPDTLDISSNIGCGQVELQHMEDADGRSLGDFELKNDARFLWVTYTPNGLQLRGLSLFVGDERDCPQENGRNAPAAFPIQYNALNQERPWSARIPLEQLNPCIFVAAQVQVAMDDREVAAVLKSGRDDTLRPGMHYCIQSCAGTSDCSLADLTQAPRTIPQAEWNQTGSDNLRQVLQRRFGDLYPRGLHMGCDFKATFASADEVLKELPMRGEAAVLKSHLAAADADHIDNRLLGELLTLELAMRLDAVLPDFSPGNVPLASLQLTKGAFEGWTLAELLQEGNGVLGGCTSNYQPAQLVEVLQAINSNFARGAKAGDYLRCPTM
jgi:hypothetical protein